MFHDIRRFTLVLGCVVAACGGGSSKPKADGSSGTGANDDGGRNDGAHDGGGGSAADGGGGSGSDADAAAADGGNDIGSDGGGVIQHGKGSLTAFTFGVDEAKKKSGTIGNDALQLQLTDAAGIKWTLKVPAGARVLPETISMAPITGIKNASGAAVPLAAGVVFEPDGLQLARAATLTVELPAAASKRVLLGYSANGKLVTYADAKLKGSTFTSNVYHFSGQGVADPTDPVALCMTVDAELKAAERALQALLHEPQPSPLPVPPDTEYECPSKDGNDPGNKAIDAFLTKLGMPEQDAIAKYLGLARVNALMCDDEANTDLAVVLPVIDRLAERANLVADAYDSDIAKIPALITALASINRIQQLLGEDADVSGRMSTLVQKMVDGLLKKLREHDFKVQTSALGAIRQAELLGLDADSDQYFAALTMTVTLDNTDFTEGTSDQGSPSVTTHTSIEITPTLTGYHAMATGNYVTSSVTGVCCDDAALTSPATFPIELTLTLSDVCAAAPFEVKLTADQLGTEEQWHLCSMDPVLQECVYDDEPDLVAEGSNELVYTKNYELDHFVFHLPAENGVEVVATQTLADSVAAPAGGRVDSTIEFEVRHTP